MDLNLMRQTYRDVGLTREKLNPNPLFQFEEWFKEASEKEQIPNSMILATVCQSGNPMLRTVLLKYFDKNF